MKNFNFGFISALIVLTLLAFTCAKEETPVEPPTKGSVRGTVIDNNTEVTLANAIIYTEPGSFQVSTDAYGDYIMKDVEPKDYKIFCYKEGYDTVSTTINVAAGIESKANFRLTSKDSIGNSTYGTIEGTVRDYSDQSYLDKATISTIPITSVTLTDASGKFKIQNVTPGDYKIIASQKDYDADTLDIKVSLGNTTEAHFALKKGNIVDPTQFGKIKGNVLDVISYTPLKNVNIYTIPATNSVSTGDAGEFLLENISPATYKIVAEKNGYFADTAEVVVKKNLESTANLFLKSLTGILEGTVIKETDGSAISKAVIKTEPNTTSVVTATDGKFRFDNLSPASYKVITSASSFITDTTIVVIKEGVTTSATIVLKRE
ncbi:MAG: carboxypeptidase regulatory-like domain-containing protein [Rhodothermaceae bacterium]